MTKPKRAAYVSAGYLKEVTAHDAEVLDIINIAFGHVNGQEVAFSAPAAAGEIARIHALRPDLKIFLSIGGWTAGGFSLLGRMPGGCERFAASCAELAEKIGLDGIDLDWEYPTIDWAGIDADPSDRENFTHMLRCLREALDKAFPDTHKMLTIAAGSGQYYVDAVDIPAIVPLLDYISIMTYDMRGAGVPTGHHTALYGKPSADNSVRIFREAGAPPEKLLIGAAFYSRRWTNIPEGGTHGLGQMCDDPNDTSSGLWGPGFADLYENYINKNGYTLYRDNGSPYLYNEKERIFLSFDDEESVAAKMRYAAEQGLYGVMYWEHGCDPTRRLMDAMQI